MRGNPALTLLAVALGVMMVGIDGTIVAVANPSIQSHLHTSLAGIQWVTNGYLLALAILLITVGMVGPLASSVSTLMPAPAPLGQLDAPSEDLRSLAVRQHPAASQDGPVCGA